MSDWEHVDKEEIIISEDGLDEAIHNAYLKGKQDMLDKIRAEIRKEMIESGKSNVKEYGTDDPYNKYEQCFLAGVYRCLEIIDKYRAESEDNE